MLTIFYCRFLVVHISATITKELKSAPAEPHEVGRHTYDGVLPSALKGMAFLMTNFPILYKGSNHF
jgi:hypothetical protein